MKLVDRHLCGEFTRTFVFALLALLAVFVTVEFFENIKLASQNNAAVGDIVLYFGARIPWILAQIVPMAALLATLVSLSLLSRRGEITAFRCGGVPLVRLALPFLACGLFLSAFQAILQEFAVPRAAAFAEEVKQIRIRKRSARALLYSQDVWLRLGQCVLHVDRVMPTATKLLTVSVAEFQGTTVLRRVDAHEAEWTGDRWIFRKAEEHVFDPSGAIRYAYHETLAYPLPATPAELRIERAGAEELPWHKLDRQIRRLKQQGLDARDLEVRLWAKTSLPFASIVMPLIGFPFALRSGRRGGASVGVALGIVLGFTYWLVLAVGLSLGKAGVLPAPAAAWAGNLVFLAAGAALLWRAERSA